MAAAQRLEKCPGHKPSRHPQQSMPRAQLPPPHRAACLITEVGFFFLAFLCKTYTATKIHKVWKETRHGAKKSSIAHRSQTSPFPPAAWQLPALPAITFQNDLALPDGWVLPSLGTGLCSPGQKKAPQMLRLL